VVLTAAHTLFKDTNSSMVIGGTEPRNAATRFFRAVGQ